MRILIASRNYFPAGVVGGAQVSIDQLKDALIGLGHEVAVLSLDSVEKLGHLGDKGVLEYRVKPKNVYVRDSEARWYSKPIYHAIDRLGTGNDEKYLSVLRDFEPDIVNSNVLAGLGVGIWRAAKKLGIPVVHTVHDYYLLCIKSGMRRNGKNCSRPCKLCDIASVKTSRAAVDAVTDVIFVSEHMKRAHENAGVFPRLSRSHIIHGAYKPDAPVVARDGLRNKGKIVLGYFGRLAPDKGVVQMIRLLSALPAESWLLKIGGTGPTAYVDEVRAAAQGLPIELLGVMKPAEFYGQIEAVIISSLWNDPAPRVSYEAGIHGVVPIVAKRGGLPEIAVHGRRGLVYDPDDPQTLVANILRLIEEPGLVDTLRRGWDGWEETFHPASVAKKTMEIYELSLGYYRSIEALQEPG